MLARAELLTCVWAAEFGRDGRIVGQERVCMSLRREVAFSKE